MTDDGIGNFDTDRAGLGVQGEREPEAAATHLTVEYGVGGKLGDDLFGAFPDVRWPPQVGSSSAASSRAGRAPRRVDDNVTLQVMPLEAGLPACLDGPVRLLETPEGRRFAYSEGQQNGRLIADSKRCAWRSPSPNRPSANRTPRM